MRLLDLYCGAGGAALGYARAGFAEIVGVDHRPQKRYPFRFVQADALEYLQQLIDGGELPDAIHASPPCQRFSVLRHAQNDKGEEHPDLIEPTRMLLRQSGVPWVMENVPSAPMEFAIELCGSMFGLGAISGDPARGIPSKWRQLRRHRIFELSFPMLQPTCQHDGSEALGVYGHGSAVSRRDDNGKLLGRRGGYQGMREEARQAMEIPYMTTREIAQAIPPAYTEFIGATLVAMIQRQDPERGPKKGAGPATTGPAPFSPEPCGWSGRLTQP